ncbi:hypothetical protein FVE85_7634 [Porphyridium purpureum]|uniref:Uncharacterized protein n=1 Tax=Porphyridium purpureum TaxID=35688 RepID=A0A5J4Z7L9_PORPP|nr:hypothetical protein FVE85_7634 [Porphyridium purpureum]|eukprot:POR9857..scf295_1
MTARLTWALCGLSCFMTRACLSNVSKLISVTTNTSHCHCHASFRTGCSRPSKRQV